jgi:hypothetical protein
MSLRTLILSLLLLACIVVAGAAWRPLLCGTAQPSTRSGLLDVPAVKSSAGDASLTRGAPAEELRGVVGDPRRTPQERAQAIHSLARAQDWKGVDVLIAQLDDSSPLVRGRAAAAVRHILGTDFYYRAEDHPAKRAIAINDLRRYWKARQTNPPTLK